MIMLSNGVFSGTSRPLLRWYSTNGPTRHFTTIFRINIGLDGDGTSRVQLVSVRMQEERAVDAPFLNL